MVRWTTYVANQEIKYLAGHESEPKKALTECVRSELGRDVHVLVPRSIVASPSPDG